MRLPVARVQATSRFPARRSRSPAKAQFATGWRPSQRPSDARTATGRPGGVDSVLTRYTRDRCARRQCRFNDPPLLRRRAIHSLRPATIHTNFYRVAHKQIVSHADTYVYTASPGRTDNQLQRGFQIPLQIGDLRLRRTGRGLAGLPATQTLWRPGKTSLQIAGQEFRA